LVLFHYALVDDLITKEEFERRVEEKIEECGDLVDEPTAAMMVVGGLGREHVKIRGLSAKSSLFSFFGKIIDKTEPKEFDRPDGEKGWVATILLGDETGTTRVVLWDQKAGAVLDTAIGEVLEVIGRHPGKSTKEIYALALRKASIGISCSAKAGPGSANLANDPIDMDAIVIATEPVRTFTKKDGTSGEMAEMIVGDGEGTARIVAWMPDLLAGLQSGTTVHITSAKPNSRSEGRNYSLDEKSTVTPTDTVVTIPFAPLVSVADQGTYSVQGEVKMVQQPRSFTTRNGAPSWVRNVIIHDGSDELRVVLWGENALIPIAPGDPVEIYNAPAKPGRSGDIELGVGRGSVIRVPKDAPQPITFRGTILPGQGCTFIDDGKDRYLIEGNFPAGTELQVTGILAGSRIIPEQVIPVEISTGDLLARIHKLAESPGP
jgi:replication factor A1